MYPQDQRIHQDYSVSPEDAYFQRERFNHAHDSVERVVALLGSTLTTLLVLRFVFALLDANQANGIVSFTNSFTQPFVAPFYNLFTYGHASIGSVSFEGYTLVAILAYGLLSVGLTKLVTVTRY
jgi:YggT family protein